MESTSDRVVLSYSFTPRELRSMARKTASLRSSVQCGTALAWLAVVGGIYEQVIGNKSLGILLLDLGLLFFFVYVLTFLFGPLFIGKADKTAFQPRTVELSDAGIHTVSGRGSFDWSWGSIRRDTLEGPTFLCFLVQYPLRSGAIIIPKRVFSSPAELDAVKHLARAHGKVLTGFALRH